MPRSAGSHVTQSSTSHNSRNKTKSTTLYHTVCKQSTVEEDLFGEPNRVAQRNELLLEKWKNKRDGRDCEAVVRDINEGKGRPCLPCEANADWKKKSKGNNKFQVPKKEIVKIISKDLIRTLTVPGGADVHPIILTQDELDRIRSKAAILTKEQKNAVEAELRRRREGEQDAHMTRRMELREYDKSRRQAAQLSELELEAQERAEHLLAKANEQRLEQEDEIKRLDELIRNAKIQAIRDTQLLEKQQVQTELEVEEQRMDQMMEVDRQNALKLQEAIEKKRKEEQLLGAAKVIEQMQENEQERLLDLEKKDQENLMMQEMLKKMMEEDVVKLEKKWKAQFEMREELKKTNAELLERKQLGKEQEKVLDELVIRFQRDKAEREAAFEKEQERVRLDKEREVARLRALQERARDEQAERDAIRARREQERLEREWRRKELDEAERKAAMERDMIDARNKQQMEHEHYMALQAQRDRAEFERVLKAQKQIIEKERQDEETTRRRRHANADEVRKQICEKEQDRIAARQAFFEEGVKLEEEARLRRLRLEAVKERKLKELREAGVPEKYLSEVERKVRDQVRSTAPPLE